MKEEAYTNRTTTSTDSFRPARKSYDPDACPADRDPDIWSLTLLFEQLAARDVDLKAPRGVIYGGIAKRVDQFNIRERQYRDALNQPCSWQNFMVAVIEEFWSRMWNEYALDQFIDVSMFRQMCNCVLDRAKYRRLAAAPVKPSPPKPEYVGPDGSRRHKRAKA